MTLAIEISPTVNQSGSSLWDIAQVKLETGQTATKYGNISYLTELDLCRRYYQKINISLKAASAYGLTQRKTFGTTTKLLTPIRTPSPKITISDNNDGIENISHTIYNNAFINITANSNTSYSIIDSEIIIDDEIPLISYPGKIQNVNMNRSSGNINLIWNEPNNRRSSISSYTIRYGTSPTSLSNINIFNSNSGSIFTDNISNYYLNIFATNGYGTGELSDMSTSSPLYSIPSGISSITGSWGFDKSYITWQPPLDNGGLPVTGYIVQTSMYNNFSNIANTVYTTDTFLSSNRIISSELSNSGSYYYRVIPLNLVENIPGLIL